MVVLVGNRMIQAVGALVCALVLWGAGGGGPAAAQDVVIDVDGQRSTEADIDAVLRGRPRNFAGLDPEEARAAATRTLVAETAIFAQTLEPSFLMPPEIRQALLDANRQVLFDFFARQDFDATPPSEDEIGAYVADNPAAFAGRVVYRFQRAEIGQGRADLAPAVADALGNLADLGQPSQTDVIALFQALAAANTPFVRSSVWDGSEVLAADFRDRLQGMQADGKTVDIREGAAETDVVILFDSYAEPIDPATVLDQMRNRILADRFAAHKEDVIRRVAALYLAGDDGAAPPIETLRSASPQRLIQMPNMALAAIGVLAFALAFTGWTAISQLRAIRLLRAEYGNGEIFINGAFVKIGGFGAVLARSGVVLALLGVGALFAVSGLRPFVTLSPTLVVTGGAAVLALVALWTEMTLVREAEDSGLRMFGVQFWVLAILTAILIAGVVLLQTL